MKTRVLLLLLSFLVLSCQKPAVTEIKQKQIESILQEFTVIRINRNLYEHLAKGPIPRNKELLMSLVAARGFDQQAFLAALQKARPTIHKQLTTNG